MVNNETRQLLWLFLLLKEGSQFLVYSINLFTLLRHLPILHEKATKLDVKSLAIAVDLCARFLDHVQLAFFTIQRHVPNHSVFRRISQLASYALQLIVAIHLLLSRLFLFLQFCQSQLNSLHVLFIFDDLLSLKNTIAGEVGLWNCVDAVA